MAFTDIHIHSLAVIPSATAIQVGDVDKVKYLIRNRHADVNYHCGSEIPLSTSLRHGHDNVFIYLLENSPVNINLRNMRGWTALATASYMGKVRIMG